MEIKREVLYLAVTADEYELPICVFDTLVELAKWAGKDRTSIWRALHLGVVDRQNNCKYIKVEITNIPPTRVIIHFAINFKKLNNNIINTNKKQPLCCDNEKPVLQYLQTLKEKNIWQQKKESEQCNE